MPSFRAYSEVSHTSHDFYILLYSILVFAVFYVVFRKLYSKRENTTIIEVKTPKRVPGTPMDTPIHITVNITHRIRSMSEFQLPPPAPKNVAVHPEIKKDI